jgi:predicted dehydrogenase
MDKISRRRFLEDSLALLTVAAAPVPAPAAIRGRRVSPNDKIHIAVIGFNGRGMNHIESYLGMYDVVITHLCDADSNLFGRALKAVEKAGKPAPKTTQDIRRVLEDKDVDAVSIATPNHWHSLGAIWAMQAGKDVYVEKPVSHNVFEGRKAVEASYRYNRICQAGTQSRASVGLKEAMKYLHSGQLGKVYLSRGLCYKPRGSIGKTNGPQPVPATVDYDLWLGPAPQKPPTRSHFHYDWHWFWDYGNGDIGNQGVHEMDKARWGLNKSGMPRSVIALGGRFGYEDDGETPNTELAFFDYGDSQLIFEVRGLKTDDLKGAKVGNIYYGEKGIMVVPSYSGAIVYDNDGNKVKEFRGGGDHFRNFLDAMRSRRRSDLNADIEEGHLSSALCHLGNISYRLGSKQPFNKKTKAFGDSKEAYETFGRFEEHLAANGVVLQETSYRLGPMLRIEQDRERFVGNRKANALLTREYRAPFVVPDKV